MMWFIFIFLEQITDYLDIDTPPSFRSCTKKKKKKNKEERNSGKGNEKISKYLRK